MSLDINSTPVKLCLVGVMMIFLFMPIVIAGCSSNEASITHDRVPPDIKLAPPAPPSNEPAQRVDPQK